MISTGPAASVITGVEASSVDGPIATESSLNMAGVVDSDAAEFVVVGSLLDDDKGFLDDSELVPSVLGGSSCLECFPATASAGSEVVVCGPANEVPDGEGSGMDTSLSGPPSASPLAFCEVPNSFISTGILLESGCCTDVDCNNPCSPDVDCAIGRVFWGECRFMGFGDI